MRDASNIPERELLQRVADGDQEAYAVLFHGHLDKLYTNALHFTKSPSLAKDICQEVFIRVWNYRHKLREVERFEAWLATVAKNFIRNTLKKKVLDVSNEDYLLAYMQDKNPGSQELLEWKEMRSQLNDAIGQLPPQMQAAFRLSRIEGLSHEQIAQQMGISRVTSQNYIARAIVFLRKYLKERNQLPGLLLLFFLS